MLLQVAGLFKTFITPVAPESGKKFRGFFFSASGCQPAGPNQTSGGGVSPVGSLAAVLAVVLVVLCFRGQLKFALTVLLKEPIGLNHKEYTRGLHSGVNWFIILVGPNHTF